MKIDQSAYRIWALLLYWQHRSKHRDRLEQNSDSVQLERVIGAVVSAAREYFHFEIIINAFNSSKIFHNFFYLIEFIPFQAGLRVRIITRRLIIPGIEVSASSVSLAYRHNMVAYPIFFFSLFFCLVNNANQRMILADGSLSDG